MSHEIETGSNGEAAFYSNREIPWHTLGTVTSEAQTAEEALRIAHMDWTVEKLPLLVDTPREKGKFTNRVQVPDRFATVRVNPFTDKLEALGVVGPVYRPVQNIENAEFLDAIVGESGAHYETAGSLRGGRSVFVTMKAPEGLMIGGEDAVDLYLVATNSHDGSSAFTVAATPIRVVCANTLRAALKGAKSVWTTRHTVNTMKRVEEAQKVLGVMWDYFNHFDEVAESMISKSMSAVEFERLVRHDLLPEPKKAKLTPRIERQYDARVAGLVGNLLTSKTIPDAMRLTRWGAYNAVTEWADWGIPIRGANPEHRRAERIATGGSHVDDIKEKAFALLSK